MIKIYVYLFFLFNLFLRGYLPNYNSKNIFKVIEIKKVPTLWVDNKRKCYFSIFDVIEVLIVTESKTNIKRK